MFSRLLHSKTIAGVSAWITVFGLLFWVLAKLTPAWFGQLTWSQLILLGIAFSLALLLLVAISVALFAVAFRKMKPLPIESEQSVSDELERTKERLKRAEERLDGARVVSATGSTATAKPPKLTSVDQERVAETIRDVFDFLGRTAQPLYDQVVRASSNQNVDFDTLAAVRVGQLDRAREAMDLWHRHSHYLELIGVDTLVLYHNIEAMTEPLDGVLEAAEWPAPALRERLNKLNQAFSDLGGTIGNIRKALSEKRAEFIRG